MDLQLFSRVLWRFRLLVAVGLVLALALATLSVARVSFAGGHPSLKYRHPEVWSSTETILLTQQGFPWGRTVFPQADPTGASSGSAQSQFADPSRFYQLASFYAELARSDAVHAILERQGPINGAVTAEAATDSVAGIQTQLPFVDLIGSATSPSVAEQLAHRGTVAFEEFLSGQQQRAKIPQSERVQVQILNRAVSAEVVTPRKKTTPIAIFLAVLIATIGAAFVLENLRPRIRSVSSVPAHEHEARA